jgi:hypothetical protein
MFSPLSMVVCGSPLHYLGQLDKSVAVLWNAIHVIVLHCLFENAEQIGNALEINEWFAASEVRNEGPSVCGT